MDTQVTSDTGRALVPVQRNGAPWVEWRPEIESAGADTIEFSFDVGVSDAMWEALERERETAQLLGQERRCVHVPDWLNAEMHPTGARGGYRFLLETPDFAVKLQKGLKDRPLIYVEMRAFGLHTHEGGELAAVEDACKYIREVLLADQDQAWAAAAITADTACCSRRLTATRGRRGASYSTSWNTPMPPLPTRRGWSWRPTLRRWSTASGAPLIRSNCCQYGKFCPRACAHG